MEIMSFILGMLTLIAVSVIATLVWGVVKIIRLQKQILSQNNSFEEFISYCDRRFNDFERSMYERTQHIENYVDRCNAEQYRNFDEIKSYIDSRIDKAVLNNKQVIKG